MKNTLITLALSSSTLAFPLSLFARSPAPHPQPQAYSVVAVDGGSTQTTAATLTVTDAVTHTSVVVSTIAQNNPQVVTVATTATIPTTLETQVPTTVTIAPSVSSVPYDNGQWHTTYWFKSTVTPAPNALVVSASTSVTAAASSTPAADLGQWSVWADKDGGALDGQWTGQQ